MQAELNEIGSITRIAIYDTHIAHNAQPQASPNRVTLHRCDHGNLDLKQRKEMGVHRVKSILGRSKALTFFIAAAEPTRFEIRTGTKTLAPPGHDDAPNLGVRTRSGHRFRQPLQNIRGHAVSIVRAIQCQGCNPLVHLVEHCIFGHKISSRACAD